MVGLSLKREAVAVVEDLQKAIAQLSSKGELELALKYVEHFCFSLVIRIYAIEKIRTKKSRETAGMDAVTNRSVKDFKKCLKLVEETHPKDVKYTEDMEVKYVGIPKKEAGKVRILGISNLVDRVLQIQFHTLLDPLIDVNLPELFFGFRKGRNTHQALAYLSHSINQSDTNRFSLLSMDISKCFDTISHEYILEHFPFPEKHKRLLVRWIKVVRVYENSSSADGLSKPKAKEKIYAGVPKGLVLGPVIANLVLAKVFEDFFEDKMFTR